VSWDGTQLDPRKIKLVTKFPIPISMINVWTILELISYSTNYVKGYFWITLPLFDLTKKDNVFD
jgi:hypothetical protein